MGPIGMPEMFILALIGLFFVSVAFWIWMLVDCISNEPSEGNDRMTWVIVVCVLGALGAFIYLVIRRPKRKQLYGR